MVRNLEEYKQKEKTDKAKIMTELADTAKFIEAQARIQKARAELQKSRYEELYFAIQVHHITNPDENDSNKGQKTSETSQPRTDDKVAADAV